MPLRNPTWVVCAHLVLISNCPSQMPGNGQHVYILIFFHFPGAQQLSRKWLFSFIIEYNVRLGLRLPPDFV